MWNTKENMNNGKIVAFADYYYEEAEKRTKNKKLSCSMAMLLGMILTLEIMVAAAMLFNIDFHATDTIALIFAFMVLYFGVVALLTDK